MCIRPIEIFWSAVKSHGTFAKIGIFKCYIPNWFQYIKGVWGSSVSIDSLCGFDLQVV